MADSQLIGSNGERNLQDFLKSLAFRLDAPVKIFPEALALMNSGSQHGLDVNWEIRFGIGRTMYKWYFESKSKGYETYNSGQGYTPFKLNLISDKLWQVLGSSEEIDCWCLFAPYLRLDEADWREIRKIQDHLPFRLLIWDQQYLFERVSILAPELFSILYSQDHQPTTSPDLKLHTLNNIRENCLLGRFWAQVHKEYWFIRNNVAQRCKKDLLFAKEMPRPQATGSIEISETKFYFEFDKRRFDIDVSYLDDAVSVSGAEFISLPGLAPDTSAVPIATGDSSNSNTTIQSVNLRKIQSIWVQAVELDTGKSLADEIKGLLNSDDIPFLHLRILHKFDDYQGKINFECLDSSIYFNVPGNKPLCFESIGGYTL